MTAVVGLVQSGSVSVGVCGMSLTVRRRVMGAPAAAERFGAGVRGPFVCLETP